MNFQTLYNNDNTRSGSNKNLIQHSSGSTDKKIMIGIQRKIFI